MPKCLGLEPLTIPLNGVLGNQRTADLGKRLMDILSLLIPNSEPSVAPEPRQGPFNHPAVAPQLLTGAVPTGADALTGDADLNPALGQGHSALWNIVSLVSTKFCRSLSGSASGPADRPDSVNQIFEEGWAQGVGSGEMTRARRSSPVDHKMALGSRFSPIYGVRASCKLPSFPTPMAEIDCEWTEARDQSIWPARLNWSRRTWRSRSQTPTFCQSRRRRQQVIP